MASWIFPAAIISLIHRLYCSNELQDNRMCDLIVDIKKDSVKSILPFTLSFRLCNAHKLYFNVVFKLPPYVALALAKPFFI